MDFLRELLNLPAKDLLTLGVVAALITTVGSLFATLLKDFILARSLENWKDKRSLESIYKRYRDPILLSSIELCNRLREITHEIPANFLSSHLMDIQVSRMVTNTELDPYFMKYKLVSTIYRLCSLLGWLELYRQEVTYLDTGKSRINRKLENCITYIRSDLADGYLNDAEDRPSWTDTYIFREEQRAIGELMIQTFKENKCVLGYAAFCELLCDSDESQKKKWLQVAANFVLDLDIDSKEKNFRYVRWLLLINHIIDLIEAIDPKRVTEKYSNVKKQNLEELKNYAIKKLHIHPQGKRLVRNMLHRP